MSPALTARSLVARASRLSVRTVGGCGEARLHDLEPDGSVVLVAAPDSPLVAELRRAADDLPVVVDAVDLCPDAGHVRGLVRLAGWLTAVGAVPTGTLLRVDVAEIILADETRTVDVDPDAYALPT